MNSRKVSLKSIQACRTLIKSVCKAVEDQVTDIVSTSHDNADILVQKVAEVQLTARTSVIYKAKFGDEVVITGISALREMRAFIELIRSLTDEELSTTPAVYFDAYCSAGDNARASMSAKVVSSIAEVKSLVEARCRKGSDLEEDWKWLCDNQPSTSHKHLHTDVLSWRLHLISDWVSAMWWIGIRDDSLWSFVRQQIKDAGRAIPYGSSLYRSCGDVARLSRRKILRAMSTLEAGLRDTESVNQVPLSRSAGSGLTTLNLRLRIVSRHPILFGSWETCQWTIKGDALSASIRINEADRVSFSMDQAQFLAEAYYFVQLSLYVKSGLWLSYYTGATRSISKEELDIQNIFAKVVFGSAFPSDLCDGSKYLQCSVDSPDNRVRPYVVCRGASSPFEFRSLVLGPFDGLYTARVGSEDLSNPSTNLGQIPVGRFVSGNLLARLNDNMSEVFARFKFSHGKLSKDESLSLPEDVTECLNVLTFAYSHKLKERSEKLSNDEARKFGGFTDVVVRFMNERKVDGA